MGQAPHASKQWYRMPSMSMKSNVSGSDFRNTKETCLSRLPNYEQACAPSKVYSRHSGSRQERQRQYILVVIGEQRRHHLAKVVEHDAIVERANQVRALPISKEIRKESAYFF